MTASVVRRALARRLPAAGLAAALVALACGPDAPPPPAGPTLDLPARPADAPGGRAFVASLGGLDVEAREARIVEELARGNVPGWLRALHRIETTVEVDGRSRALTFWAAPDYLAVGSDDDFVLVPLSPRSARRAARRAGGSLPTPAMVDAIWRSAGERLIPIRFRPDEEMGSIRYLVRHNRVILAQREQQGAPPGTLVAGHKLDVVRSGAAGAGTDTLALYGWHRSDGTPIQPLFPVAPELEPHYSMGVRVVDDVVWVDGEVMALAEALRDTE